MANRYEGTGNKHKDFETKSSGAGFNPWAGIVGNEEFNPFTGNLQMKQGEGLSSFRNRIAEQIKTSQSGMDTILDPTRQAGAIGEIAKGLTTGISGDQAAGQAVEDVDQQFAGQEKALQLRQSRMGIDPSQGASITGQRQQRIAQASARAGAMQSARRGAEQSNMNQFQNNLGLGANLVGRQTEFQLQQGQKSLRQLQGQGAGAERKITNAKFAAGRNQSSMALTQNLYDKEKRNLSNLSGKDKAKSEDRMAQMRNAMESLRQDAGDNRTLLNGGSARAANYTDMAETRLRRQSNSRGAGHYNSQSGQFVRSGSSQNSNSGKPASGPANPMSPMQMGG